MYSNYPGIAQVVKTPKNCYKAYPYIRILGNTEDTHWELIVRSQVRIVFVLTDTLQKFNLAINNYLKNEPHIDFQSQILCIYCPIIDSPSVRLFYHKYHTITTYTLPRRYWLAAPLSLSRQYTHLTCFIYRTPANFENITFILLQYRVPSQRNHFHYTSMQAYRAASVEWRKSFQFKYNTVEVANASRDVEGMGRIGEQTPF